MEYDRIAENLAAGNFSEVGRLVSDSGRSLAHLLETHDAPAEVKEEAFACACFLGLNADITSLLDGGVDPTAGRRSGQSGFHYAAMNGYTATVRLLLEREVPLEVRNRYGGTVLGQTLWSAIHEPVPTHPQIIEMLIEGGAEAPEEMRDWWDGQQISPPGVKIRIAEVLSRSIG